MKFCALDIETVNADMASICQIGLATFENQYVIDEWNILIDPDGHFDPINCSIHGITAKDIVGAPQFPAIFDELSARTKQEVVVTHTHFDRVA